MPEHEEPEHEEPDDETLLLAWREGDRRAGSTLVGRHYHRIARFFSVRYQRDWEELTQSTFLGCVEGVQRFRGDASFATFIFAIAHKKLLKQFRDQSRDRRRARLVHDSGDVSLSAPEPEGAACQQVLAVLHGLPADTQVMLELHYWEDVNIRAIAARFGLPEGTIKARLHRARRQIMIELAGLAGSPEEFTILRRALELWADELSGECGGDGAVNPASDATTRMRGEQSRRHEDHHPSSPPTAPRHPRDGRGLRCYRL